MTASIASAWIAIRRPTVLWTVLVAVVGFSALSTVIDFMTATTGAASDQPGPAATSIAELSQASGIVHGVAGATTFLGVIAISLGAFSFASDLQNGLVRTLLVRQPRRVVFAAGKAIALYGLLAFAALLGTMVSAVIATVLASGQGVNTDSWSAVQVVAGWVQVTAALLGFATLGAALGLLLRSPVAAIGFGIAWVLPVEQVLSAAWDNAANVLPGQLLDAVADGSATPGQSVVLLAWLALLAGGAVWTFTRRDIRI